jgi:hypothetical protein
MTNSTSTNRDDDLLDAHQVSVQEFGGMVPARTIESWRGPRRAQPLPFIRIGRKCFYRRSDVADFKNRNTTLPVKD